MNNIAVVVVAYNRPRSLSRLLKSLNTAHYDEKLDLIISIDFTDTEDHEKVVGVAENFKCNFGYKKIIKHRTNLGLKRHVLSCGDLSAQYDAIIMLEDDLYVSREFYIYSKKVLSFYEKDPKIGGVSLYNHCLNINNLVPFKPLETNSDVYFLQIASSWGQAWTRKHWESFRAWYDRETLERADFSNLPSFIANWPESSWLKLFIKFLVDQNKYFVYPKISLTSNFSDAGTNNRLKNTNFQVPLQIEDRHYKFESFNASRNIYDSYFELIPEVFKSQAQSLKNLELTVDMYGLKPLDSIKTEFLLSSKKLRADFNSKSVSSFSLELKPMQMNIIEDIRGDFFHLDKPHNFTEERKVEYFNLESFYYFLFRVKLMDLIKIVVKKIKKQII